VYGKPLVGLESEWLAEVDAGTGTLAFQAEELPVAYEALLKDYSTFFSVVAEGKYDAAQYQSLDQRRLAILRGQLSLG
jgi:hypothetical protein